MGDAPSGFMLGDTKITYDGIITIKKPSPT